MQWNEIGVIHTPFTRTEGTPIQPTMAEGAEGVVELDERWVEGLADLEGFEWIWLIYRLHRVGPTRLRVVPFLDDCERGVFATRAPCRPNPLGLSCVRLEAVEGRRLRVSGVDVLDGTPLLDIKPYVPRFDAHPEARAGWVDHSRQRRRRADDRFDAGE